MTRKPSPTLDALTRAATSTRFSARVAAAESGDARARTLLERAAAVPLDEQVVTRVATHFVACYMSAVHGEKEPEIDSVEAVEAFAAELRKVRQDWRKRRAGIQTVTTLAADEVAAMLRMVQHFTGFLDEATNQERSETGAIIRGFVARVAVRIGGELHRTDVALHHIIGDPSMVDDPDADRAVTAPAWVADLEEARRATRGDPIEPEVTEQLDAVIGGDRS